MPGKTAHALIKILPSAKLMTIPDTCYNLHQGNSYVVSKCREVLLSTGKAFLTGLQRLKRPVI